MTGRKYARQRIGGTIRLGSWASRRAEPKTNATSTTSRGIWRPNSSCAIRRSVECHRAGVSGIVTYASSSRRTYSCWGGLASVVSPIFTSSSDAIGEPAWPQRRQRIRPKSNTGADSRLRSGPVLSRRIMLEGLLAGEA